MDDWNTKTITDFRAHQGRVGGQFEGAPMYLVDEGDPGRGPAAGVSLLVPRRSPVEVRPARLVPGPARPTGPQQPLSGLAR